MQDTLQFGGMAGVAGGVLAAVLYLILVTGEQIDYLIAFAALIVGTVTASILATRLLSLKHAKAGLLTLPERHGKRRTSKV